MKITKVIASEVNHPSIWKKDGVLHDFPLFLFRGLEEHPIPLNSTFRNWKRGDFPFRSA